MMRHACFMTVVAVISWAGCSAGSPQAENGGPDGSVPGDGGPGDGGVDAPNEPPVDPPPPPPPPPELAEMCGGEVPETLAEWEFCYKKRWCEWRVGCLPQNSYRDVQECIDDSYLNEGGRLAAEFRELTRAVDQDRARLNAAAFAQCLADTSDAFCNTARFSVACATRFTGTIGDGDTCYADVECASPGATCESSCPDACCAGTCRPEFKEGEPCDLSDSCQPGLVCHRTCLSGDIRDPCGSSRDCDSNAWCDDGFCIADLAPGAACTSLLQCGGQTSCVGLSITDPTPGRCLSVSKAGDRCDSFCYGNLYCDGSGVCRALPELGQSCSGYTSCRGIDTTCSNGQCILRGSEGMACSSSRTCQSGLFCTSELNDPQPTCAAPGSTGQRCAAPGHCQSYLCSNEASQPRVCLAWSDTCPLTEEAL